MSINQRSGGSSTVSTGTADPGASYRHAQLLRQFNEDIFRQHALTDVELVVDGEVVGSHRSVVVCFSPYLRRKLMSAEGKPLDSRVHIPKIRKKEFGVLLHYMYTGDLNVTYNNFLELYEAASILEMQDVMQECIQILEPRDDIRTYFYLYVTSKKLGVRANCLRALRLLTHRFEEVVCAPEFLKLPVDLVVEILSAQNIGARSEVIVFLAALKWLNHSYSTRREHELRAMGCVRFSSMTMDEVVACYHPPYLPQILNNPGIVTMLFRATCYITAKFLGQESWFKNFGNPKRNLAFENLPMELWHQKTSPIVSDMDISRNWKESLNSKFPPKDTKKKTDTERQLPYLQGTKIIESASMNNEMPSKTYFTEALKKVLKESERSLTSTEFSEEFYQSREDTSRQENSKTAGQNENYNTPDFIEASEMNINIDDDQLNETSTFKAESFNSESAMSLVEAKHRGSDFVVQIEAPTFPEDLDEYPVKEYTKTEMSNLGLDKPLGEDTASSENKQLGGSQLRGGGYPPDKQNSPNKANPMKTIFPKGHQQPGQSPGGGRKGYLQKIHGKMPTGTEVKGSPQKDPGKMQLGSQVTGSPKKHQGKVPVSSQAGGSLEKRHTKMPPGPLMTGSPQKRHEFRPAGSQVTSSQQKGHEKLPPGLDMKGPEVFRLKADNAKVKIKEKRSSLNIHQPKQSK